MEKSHQWEHGYHSDTTCRQTPGHFESDTFCLLTKRNTELLFLRGENIGWSKEMQKQGNRRREFMPRARTLRTHWVLWLFANQSYKTWAEANHSDECIPRTEIGCEVPCWGAHKAATKKRKFTPAYAAQSMFFPLQAMYGLDSDDYTVLADRCMKRRSKRASPDRKQGLQEDEKRQATKTTMVD